MASMGFLGEDTFQVCRSAPCGLPINPARWPKIDSGMKWKIIISFVLAAGLAKVSAEDSPLPSPSPSASSSGEMQEPALPLPDPGQSNPETGLLPESGELPASRSPEVPSKLSTERAAPEAASKSSGRFDEIRSLAMNSPRAAYLLKRARHSSNSAARHLYFHAYYVAVASQMRKLDPSLKSSIETYEETHIHEVSGSHPSPARIALHRSRVHRTASQEHHRSHRVSYQHHYRRYIIIDYPYGPPYGPYGPEFPPYGPPYGPPMVFYP
jgi:hypothetical protein